MKFRTTPLAGLLSASLMLGGCVSASPRPYMPVLRPPPEDRLAFERDFTACASEVAIGKHAFGQSGGAVAVATTGGVATAQVVGGGALGASVIGSGGTGSALVLSGVGILILAPVAVSYGLSATRRRHNEEQVQQAMTTCLAQNGRSVAGWTRVSSAQADGAVLLTPTHYKASTQP